MPPPSPLRSCHVESTNSEYDPPVLVCCAAIDDCVVAPSEGCGAPTVDYACHRARPTTVDPTLRCLQLRDEADGYASYCCAPSDVCFTDDVVRYDFPSCDGQRVDCFGDAAAPGDASTDAAGSCRFLERSVGTGVTGATAYCCSR